ncbi:transcription factor domain-containing protein [Aspergillus stella-maris]|uniref:transcription factor domain-containing protein n=1 Tax=Aspergillus stella-maris TaxID=1810926 RepID=UPI003CCE5201
MQAPKLNKSCDQCRARKVRCIVPPGGPSVCIHCIKRNETCQFSNLKRRLRVKEDTSKPSSDLFIDRLLRNPFESVVLYDEFSILKVHDDQIPSSGLAFFSERRVNSMVKRLGHTRVKDLVHQIDVTIKTRLLARPGKDISLYSLAKDPRELIVDPEAAVHVQRFFEILHPVYPFLDRKTFEERTKHPDLLRDLETDHAFCGLYYAIISLGCQYNGCSSFIPDNSHAWKLFQVALSRLDQIILSTTSLSNLQTIFATNTFSLQLDQTLLAEACRMVLALRYHKSIINEDSSLCHRIFWVIYHLEKRYCFAARISSVIADDDIGCPIPPTPESILGGYDWLRSSVRFGRILSVAYSSLFSISASTQSETVILIAIDHVCELLEEWRLSIPIEFRPREPIQRRCLNDGASKEIALRTHYYYCHLSIALERLTLHVSRDIARSENSMRSLLNTAKQIIDLMRYIDVEPYTPVFILAIIPLSAMFILFDFVVHHPNDPDIRGYLTLLDIVAGHFSQLDHASNGTIQSSYLSEFSHTARQYIQNEQNKQSEQAPAPPVPSESQPPAADTMAPTMISGDSSIPTNDPGLSEGIDYGSLDNFYFLTPDSDWPSMTSLDEFDPREYYGSIFL